MLLSAGGAVGLRMPFQLSFLEEGLVEKEMQLLRAAPLLEGWPFSWLAFTVAATSPEGDSWCWPAASRQRRKDALEHVELPGWRGYVQLSLPSPFLSA